MFSAKQQSLVLLPKQRCKNSIDSAKCQSLMFLSRYIVLDVNRSGKRQSTAFNNDCKCSHQIMALKVNRMASCIFLYVSCEEVSEELQSFLEAVDSGLQQCSMHEGIQDAGFVLCVVSSLQNAITVLQCIF